MSSDASKSVVSLSQAACVLGVRQPRREPKSEGRAPGSFPEQPNLGADDEVFDRVRGVAGRVHRRRSERRRPPFRDTEPIERTTVDLHLGDRADAHADPHDGQPPQVPLQSRQRVGRIVGIVDAALNQDPSGSDRFRVFGDEGPLLRAGWLGQKRGPRWRQRHERMSPHDAVPFESE